MNSEAAFLFSTFKEFVKCWRSGTRARVFIESFNRGAFVNFSAYLGHPDDVHFRPRPTKRNPSRVPRKKSEKKRKRDNDRAARFQERKRKEEEAASASIASGNPDAIVTSSPGAASAMTVSDREFSFASPVPENLRHDKSKDTSLNVSDKIEPGEQEDDDNIEPLPEIHSEEKVQDQESSETGIDSDEDIKFCQVVKFYTCCKCKDCETIFYPMSPNSTEIFMKARGMYCHSQQERCINFKNI